MLREREMDAYIDELLALFSPGQNSLPRTTVAPEAAVS